MNRSPLPCEIDYICQLYTGSSMHIAGNFPGISCTGAVVGGLYEHWSTFSWDGIFTRTLEYCMHGHFERILIALDFVQIIITELSLSLLKPY